MQSFEPLQFYQTPGIGGFPVFIFKLPQEVSSSASTDSEFWPGLRSRYPGCSLSSKGLSAAPVQLGPQMYCNLEAFPLTWPIHHAIPRGVVGRFERVWNQLVPRPLHLKIAGW